MDGTADARYLKLWRDQGRRTFTSGRGGFRSARAGSGVPLETKLHPPAPREQWLQRGELIRYLSRTAARLILVAAPAGFGKTTVVAQWRARSIESTPFAWISLDRGDNDPGRLWLHIISALQRACPELGGGSTLRWPPPEAAVVGGTIVPALVNELAALRARVVLVLDDFHVIKDRGCREQIDFLLAHMPPSVQVVLITRADPLLPLARMRAAGELAQIRMAQLRFTTAETAALVSAVAAVELGKGEAADLVERTGGSPAGLYMAALSLRDTPYPGAFIRQLADSNRCIIDFLAEEVLNHQPADARRFLMRTSILDRFTASLCDAVAGVRNAAEVIERLSHENLLIVALDDTGTWSRYHDLFAQMLRSQLMRAEPGIVPTLHQRASAWHRQQGSAEEAIGHALAAGDSAALLRDTLRSQQQTKDVALTS